jgi:hypothetical protein
MCVWDPFNLQKMVTNFIRLSSISKNKIFLWRLDTTMSTGWVSAADINSWHSYQKKSCLNMQIAGLMLLITMCHAYKVIFANLWHSSIKLFVIPCDYHNTLWSVMSQIMGHLFKPLKTLRTITAFHLCISSCRKKCQLQYMPPLNFSGIFLRCWNKLSQYWLNLKILKCRH